MNRYLLYVSYVGTYFRATQKQVVRADPSISDPDSVQGLIEILLKGLKPRNNPEVILSSRTDQGVHALKAPIHVDLESSYGKPYNPSAVVRCLNQQFSKRKAGIRAQSCCIVPDSFHARFSAKRRSYLYRVAVRKSNLPDLEVPARNHVAEIPFADWSRCYFVQNSSFDVTLAQQAADLFLGTKDFRSFKRTVKGEENKNTVRTIYKLDIAPGKPFMPDEYSPMNSHYNFWDFKFEADSFLYRQVRRTVGVLLAVAQGNISMETVKNLLENPSKDSWDPRASTVPAYGLYLVNVEYDPVDLVVTS